MHTRTVYTAGAARLARRSRIASDGARRPRARRSSGRSEHLAPYGMRSARSRGRRYPEDEHALRTRYQRDRDRVIHSSSFRRLEYKTQVFVNHEGDNYRTRLTHSLEGAQIGRSVARALGLNEELTECLVLGPRPRPHAVRPLGRAGDGRADARPRRLRAQPADAAHPGGAGGALPGLPGPEPDLGGARGHHQAPAGQRRRTRPPSTRRARRPRSRPSSSISWTRSPTTTTTSTTASARGCSRVEQIRAVALFREAHDAVAGARASRTSGIAAPPGGAPDHRPLHAATCSRRTLANLRAGARAARWRTCAAPAAGSSATRRRWPRRVRELKDFLLTEHVPPLPRGADGGQGRPDPARPVPVLRRRAAAASRRATRSGSRRTACTAWSATTSRA